MKKQVGWYNPKSGGLCMKHDKVPSPAYEMYTVPVFADDTGTVYTDDAVNETVSKVPVFTGDEEPVPECKKPRNENSEDDGLMDEICVQTLENLSAMILATLQSPGNGVVMMNTRRNLTSMHKKSVELLERLKKNEQARGD